MVRILITGGNGYIAQAIYASLKNEHNITLITRKDFDLTDSELTNQWFKDKYFDVVIHTAIVGGNRLKPEDKTKWVLGFNHYGSGDYKYKNVGVATH